MVMGKDMKVPFLNSFGSLFKLLPGVVELAPTWFGLSELVLVWSGLLGSPGWSTIGFRMSSNGSSGLLRGSRSFLDGFESNFEVG